MLIKDSLWKIETNLVNDPVRVSDGKGVTILHLISHKSIEEMQIVRTMVTGHNTYVKYFLGQKSNK